MIEIGTARIALTLLLFVQQGALERLTRHRRKRKRIHSSGRDMLVLLWVVYVALLLLIALMPYARWDAHVVVGFALVAVGVALRVWALLALGDSYAPAITVYEGQQVVRYGAYAQLAHPLYAGVAIELIGLAVFANSGAGYGLAFVGIAAARVQIAREERLLTATYGSAYTDYRRHVWDFGDSASTGR